MRPELEPEHPTYQARRGRRRSTYEEPAERAPESPVKVRPMTVPEPGPRSRKALTRDGRVIEAEDEAAAEQWDERLWTRGTP